MTLRIDKVIPVAHMYVSLIAEIRVALNAVQIGAYSTLLFPQMSVEFSQLRVSKHTLLFPMYDICV